MKYLFKFTLLFGFLRQYIVGTCLIFLTTTVIISFIPRQIFIQNVNNSVQFLILSRRRRADSPPINYSSPSPRPPVNNTGNSLRVPVSTGNNLLPAGHSRRNLRRAEPRNYNPNNPDQVRGLEIECARLFIDLFI